jgi:plasmid stabilization system protein ParE
MAYRIFWTPIAVQDLRDICDFISRDNPVASQRMTGRIFALKRQLPAWQKKISQSPTR